ncbi:Glutathione-regulated potassium-efflux system protein KefB [uncultured archaeon]|nr:Glutathione-regulated potassium-efflux system protein KefB [uncultured archaeon]
MDAALAVGISITVIMLSALVFERLKLPLILGVLLAGILMGPSSPLAGISIFGFQFSTILISDPSLVSVFAVIGSALILFGIGLEFSVIKLTQLGSSTFLAAVLKIGIVYLVAYSSLTFFNFSAAASALVAVALSFSSTPIIIKLLDACGKFRRPEVPFIISILIIEDLLAVFFLGLISKSASGMSEYMFVLSLLRVVLTFAFAYFIVSRIISRFLSLISYSDELLILGTVSLVLVIGYLAEAIGLSFSVGAFLAGSTIAGFAESRKIEERIRPFNSLFNSFFFFSIGLLVSIGSVFSNLQLLLLFLAIGIGVRFFASGVSAYFAGFSGRSACFCAAAFLPMSELSLLLMSQGVVEGIVSAEFLSSFAFAIILSSFVSVWLVNRENGIYNLHLMITPKFLIKNARLLRSTVVGMRRAVSESSRYYRVVEILPVISYQPDQFSTHEQLTLTAKNSAVLSIASLACYVLIFLSQEPGWEFLQTFSIYTFIGFIGTSLLFLGNMSSTFNTLLKMVMRSSSDMKYAVAGHLLIGLFFLILCVIYAAAYAFVPLSFAVVLTLPPFFFAVRSLYLTFRTVEAHGARL